MGLEEVSININDQTLKLETGKLAKQADGSVTVQYGDNIILSTAAMSDPREGIDFFLFLLNLKKECMLEERSLEVFSKEKDALVHQLY